MRAQTLVHRLKRRSFSDDYKTTSAELPPYNTTTTSTNPRPTTSDGVRSHKRTTSARSSNSATFTLAVSSTPPSPRNTLPRTTTPTVSPMSLARANSTALCTASADTGSTKYGASSSLAAAMAPSAAGSSCVACAPVHEEEAGALAVPPPVAFRPRKRSLSVGGENMCRDFFARQIEQYGLQSLLSSPVAVCYFMASTISTFSPENLLFYLEAEHYRTASFPSEDRRRRYAKGLYKSFISHSAPLEINISHSMRQHITQVFRSNEPITSALFQETQNHAYALLDQDFALFRQRPLFNRMMAELSSASTATGTSQRKDNQNQRLRAVSALYDALSKTYGVYSLPLNKSKLIETEMPSFTKFADMELTSADVKVALPAWLSRTTIRILDTPMPSSYEEWCQLQRLASESASQLPYSRPSMSSCGPQLLASPPSTQHKQLLHFFGGGSSSSLVSKLRPSIQSSSFSASASTQSTIDAVDANQSHVPAPPMPTIPFTAAPSAVASSHQESMPKKANKQKSLQRLRSKLQFEADAQASSAMPPSSSQTDIASTMHASAAAAAASLPPPSAKSRWGSLWGSRRRKA
ncbi:hypothetical protein GGI12_003767 [Dipsacomyces acuminosporus]|nr:hypothetical protein GGI12_003767 [Dipsacomyces acuminosporus]